MRFGSGWCSLGHRNRTTSPVSVVFHCPNLFQDCCPNQACGHLLDSIIGHVRGIHRISVNVVRVVLDNERVRMLLS
jgi:hypothetical protein